MKKTCLLLLLCFSFISFYGQEKAKPREGEGINAFLIRNNRPGKENYQKFLELNSRRLGKNNVLKTGLPYILPPLNANEEEPGKTGEKEVKRREPLFGEKWADYTVKSDGRLKGACYFLVSGHGGPDPGAIGKLNGKDLCEDEYAYDIMLRLARVLLIEGAKVYIIIQDAKDGIRDDEYLANSDRETCMGDPIPLSQKKRLQQQCDKINKLSRKSDAAYQRAFFIHLDSRSAEQRVDVFFYYAENSKNGRRLANTLRTTFQSKYDLHQPNRGFRGTVSTRSLHVLLHTDPVVVFTELGNIRNSFDQRRFLNIDNRQALANWICLGFIKDYEDFKETGKD